MANNLKSKLTIDTGPFRKGLKDATSSTKKFATSAKSKFAAAAKAAKGMLLPIAAISAAIGAIVFAPIKAFKTAIDGLAESLDKVGKVASNLEIDTGFLQSIQLRAELSGLEVSNLDQIFRRVIRSSYDASLGTKKAADAYARLGVNVQKANGDLKSADDLFLEVGDGLSKIQSATDRAALSMEVFGRSGAELAVLFEGGAEELRQFKEAADDLGIIVPEETIRRMEQLNDELSVLKKLAKASAAEGLEAVGEFDVAWQKIANVFVDIGTWLSNVFLPMLTSIFNYIFKIPDAFRAATNGVKNGFIEMKIKALEFAEAASFGLKDNSEAIKKLRDQQLQMNAEYLKSVELIQKKKALEILIGVEGKANEAARKAPARSSTDVPTGDTTSKTTKTDAHVKLYEKRKEAAYKLAEALRPITEQKQRQYEIDLQTLSLIEDKAAREEAIAARTMQRDKEIAEAAAKAYEEKYGKLMEMSEQFADSLSAAIVDSLDDGKKAFEDFAKSFLKQITKMIIKAAILAAIQSSGFGGGAGAGGGGFGAAFAGNFAGGRAHGGYIPPGKMALVGEKGPELIQTGAAGANVTPNDKIGGDVNISIENTGAAKNVNAQFDEKNNVVRIVMEDLQAGGQLSRLIKTKG